MLEHIFKWDTTHGWIRVEANIAYKDYPFGLSSFSEQFLCETCGQYASFVAGGSQRPHFRHPNGSRNCDDKLTSYGLYRSANPLGFSLPLRIRISQNSFEVLIGFLPLPFTKMEHAESNDSMLKITNAHGKIIGNYSITRERFSCDHITYISIGGEISERYQLTYISGSSYYWPKVVDGISSGGTIFDCATGKRLPRNACVIVGEQYWLLTQTSVWHCADINIDLEKTLGNWNLYRLQAQKLSKEAAEFFLRYGTRLTDKPSEVIHIWPPAIHSSHFLMHCANKIWLYKTDGYIDMYPTRKQYQYEGGIFTVEKSQFEQILSLSRFENRTSVLKYTLVRYTPQMQRQQEYLRHALRITDIHGVPFESGEHISLPSKRELWIDSDFDGFIRIESKGFEVDRLYFKGKEKNAVTVRFNQKLSIFQGLDCVAEISFLRPTTLLQDDDADFALSLTRCSGCSVKVSHVLGGLADRMHNMPTTKQWLKDQLFKGMIKSDAILLLTKRFGRV